MQRRQSLLDDYYKSIEKSAADFSEIGGKDISAITQNQSMIAVNKNKVKYTVFYDKPEDRYLVVENSYEMQKYFVLEFDESKVTHGSGNSL